MEKMKETLCRIVEFRSLCPHCGNTNYHVSYGEVTCEECHKKYKAIFDVKEI